ncbi:transcriptional regulator with XRE-family HTH domain [Streptomyces aurantiacus]|uniref:helix-turn-helix domain-containing protein n=1 Tax=Streptomyces aurantiacus TaxID=47760 RepID=UPI00278DB62B|nr:helix-turn-helix transcriptional regulator [Streptomyces aurantiacus]MDQ0777562.1 transcriptional regulator with XRE-family HTH domain [Streptomyces aurantiacus]
MSRPENSLGEALRAWRDRLTTDDVGLPATGRRRTAGLRREEVASLAGVSVDYLLRLEQGRARCPSRHVIASIARALRLTGDEVCHLHLVAGLLPPVAGQVPHEVPPSVDRLVSRWEGTAVGVFSASWTLLTWTQSWAALLGDPGARPPRERNLIRAVFAEPTAAGHSALFPFPADQNTAAFKAALVADLRLALAAYPGEKELAELVRESAQVSADFREVWGTATLGSRLGGRTRIQHPLVGEIVLDSDVLKVPDHDVRIMTYTAEPGTPDAEKLDLLRGTTARTALPLSAG